MISKNAKIYVAGHRGLVGSAILRALSASGYRNIVTRTSQQLDLRSQKKVRDFFQRERPAYVYLAAATVGGIMANSQRPAEFIYNNLSIETNVIQTAYETKVRKLLFLGSSCIYPRAAKQPIREEYLLSGPLETTNEAYAIAKIAGLKLCEYYNQQYGTQFISAMPTNLYGPGDNFDLTSAHVLPALIRKFHEAKQAGSPAVKLWGSGRPRREFLYVDDLASALLFLMDNYDGSQGIINIGWGKDLSIRELASQVKLVTGFSGRIEWDRSKPDGTPRKLLDTSRLSALGWRPRISLEEGLLETYGWYLENEGKARK